MTGEAAVPMLDSHVHLWDLTVRDQAWIPAGSPIRRTFGVSDLRSALAGTPVDSVILVQASNDAGETTDLISCAASEDLIRGVVGWADLRSPGVAAALSALATTGWLLGLRHQALAEGRRVAGQVRAGTVWINGGGSMRPDAPFGGYGRSGIGRELGEWGMREYLEVKHIQWRV